MSHSNSKRWYVRTRSWRHDAAQLKCNLKSLWTHESLSTTHRMVLRTHNLSLSPLYLPLTPTTGRVKYFDTAIYMLSAIRFRRHVHSHDEIWTYNFHPMLLCYGGKFSNKQRKCVQPRSVRCARAYCAHIIASRKIHMKRNRWRRKTRRYIGK